MPIRKIALIFYLTFVSAVKCMIEASILSYPFYGPLAVWDIAGTNMVIVTQPPQNTL